MSFEAYLKGGVETTKEVTLSSVNEFWTACSAYVWVVITSFSMVISQKITFSLLTFAHFRKYSKVSCHLITMLVKTD